jgi:hypothetical protein
LCPTRCAQMNFEPHWRPDGAPRRIDLSQCRSAPVRAGFRISRRRSDACPTQSPSSQPSAPSAEKRSRPAQVLLAALDDVRAAVPSPARMLRPEPAERRRRRPAPVKDPPRWNRRR